MNNISWKKQLAIWSNRLYLYPRPEPLQRKRAFWIASGCVALAALVFAIYFILYLIGRHDAFQTNAEDFGIMDQAIWNTIRGNGLRQTICNILTDTNCYDANGVMRFAIHFEPILFPISLLYLLWPSAKLLLIVQTIIVALGAFPAFWLARLRLRNEWIAVGIALVYLLYPAQQQATSFDFHAVTFTCALLMFMLYFMYTRRLVGVFSCAILAMSCKEQMPIVIAFYGIWFALFMREWRAGLILAVIGTGWFLVAVKLIMPGFSPTGEPLLSSRFSNLGNGPVEILRNTIGRPVGFVRDYILETNHRNYLRLLFLPVVFLPLLAPWVLLLALPSLAINLLSSNPLMYSGLFQYSAEIVPVIVFSTIEAMVLLVFVIQRVLAWWRNRQERKLSGAVAELPHRPIGKIQHALQTSLLSVLLLSSIGLSLRTDYRFHGSLPFSLDFTWPQTTAHTDLANRFIDLIPDDAVVSAQTKLVPHLSHRSYIYMFPYQAETADYVLLDVTSDIYPYLSSGEYMDSVQNLLLDGTHGILATEDGYILLKKGLTPQEGAPRTSLTMVGDTAQQRLVQMPESFCTNMNAEESEIKQPLEVSFRGYGGAMQLLGTDVQAGEPFSRSGGYMTVSTYWRVQQPMQQALQMEIITVNPDKQEYFASNNVPGAIWCPTNSWKAGQIIKLTSRLFQVPQKETPNGLVHLAFALIPLAESSSTIKDVHVRLPFQIEKGSEFVSPTEGTNALQIKALTIVQ